MLLLIRRVGALVLVGAAVYIWFAKAPATPATADHRAAVAAIERQDDADNGRTQGAPQQAVVNGWTTNAYLRLISGQLAADDARQASRDARPAALLVLGVLGIALLAFTSPGPLLPSRGSDRRDRPARGPAGPHAATPPPGPPADGPAPRPPDDDLDTTKPLGGLPLRRPPAQPPADPVQPEPRE